MPFLGHIVGRAGLECDPNKLSAVANWIPPSTIKGVREFFGFTGYYRRFVPDFSTVAQPLVRLLGKDCKFKWTDACLDAFKALRTLLIKAPVLQTYHILLTPTPVTMALEAFYPNASREQNMSSLTTARA